MKFKFHGNTEDLTKRYKEARDAFNKENRSRSSALIAYLKKDSLEIGVDNTRGGIGYWFCPSIVEHDGYIELEGDIKPDKDARMRWYDWLGFSVLLIIACVPILVACLVTKSTPFGTKKKRIKRLRSYMCKYLGCEEIT